MTPEEWNTRTEIEEANDALQSAIEEHHNAHLREKTARTQFDEAEFNRHEKQEALQRAQEETERALQRAQEAQDKLDQLVARAYEPEPAPTAEDVSKAIDALKSAVARQKQAQQALQEAQQRAQSTAMQANKTARRAYAEENNSTRTAILKEHADNARQNNKAQQEKQQAEIALKRANEAEEQARSTAHQLFKAFEESAKK